MTRLPKDISDKVKELVCKEADRVCYLALSRPDSGSFVDELVINPDVGGIISQYLVKEKVRTYIKDGILNKYSKDKEKSARFSNIVPLIKKHFGFPVTLISDANSNGVALYRASETGINYYIIVTNGTYLKWETALKKALVYPIAKPFVKNTGCKIHIMLSLFCGGKKINTADKQHINEAIKVCNAAAIFYGES